MSETKSGGPAFPSDWYPQGGEPTQGMTLRDYFAAKALEGWCASSSDESLNVFNVAEVAPRIASAMYVIADAMMKARGEKS